MSKGVAITGMGIISAIGNNVSENYNALLAGRCGIGTVEKIQTNLKDSIKVGEIGMSNTAMEAALDLESNHNYTRTTLLGVLAAKEAVAQAGIVDMHAYKTGIVSATSVGGMDFTEKHYYKYLEDADLRRFVPGHHAGDAAEKMAEQLGVSQSLVTTISTACSSAANAIMFGARLIKSGKLDRVIVGGSDCLSKFTINGFNTLMILSDDKNTPFDQNRKGLNLGEAAAYLVLESEAVVSAENKEVLAYVKGYGNANDAFHQTASSENGDGATLAMEKALAVANMKAEQIDYINAHGTATRNNDLSEGRALMRVFKNGVPEFSSTKPYTGHTLAAAGGVEAVYAVLALQNQKLFPNLNYQTPMEEIPLRPELELKDKKINAVLSNSLGFGGNCSTIIFTLEP
ncbi:MAG: beta-ketoacyl-[acyl-carrier-protein] synthase family protein [Flavobacteriaceae bacterium]|nr:beta-ketoacyl-[acyl-carrier-protein] synthase family protein [Flavobacteriaceae bacterium]